MSKKIAVIICAAGAGTRFGGSRKKTFIDVAGRAPLLRSIELFANRPDVKQIIAAISPEDEELVNVKWGDSLKFHGVKLCFGGKQRYETVSNALKEVREDVELVAVHDAVRCCTREQWINEVFTQAAKTGAAILAAPVVGTVKEVRDDKIISTLDRSNLYEAQTPQVFEKELLKRAYAELSQAEQEITDDAQLLERLGQEVSIVKTDSTNIKITTKSDLTLAEAIIKTQQKKPAKPLGAFEEMQW